MPCQRAAHRPAGATDRWTARAAAGTRAPVPGLSGTTGRHPTSPRRRRRSLDPPGAAAFDRERGRGRHGSQGPWPGHDRGRQRRLPARGGRMSASDWRRLHTGRAAKRRRRCQQEWRPDDGVRSQDRYCIFVQHTPGIRPWQAQRHPRTSTAATTCTTPDDVPNRPLDVRCGPPAARLAALRWRHRSPRTSHAAPQARLRTLRRRPAARLHRRPHLLVRMHFLRRLCRPAPREPLPELRRRTGAPPHPAARQAGRPPGLDHARPQAAARRPGRLRAKRRHRPPQRRARHFGHLTPGSARRGAGAPSQEWRHAPHVRLDRRRPGRPPPARLLVPSCG